MFWTAKRQELATLFRHALVDRQGMLVLTGEEGSGKTAFRSRRVGGLGRTEVKSDIGVVREIIFPNTTQNGDL